MHLKTSFEICYGESHDLCQFTHARFIMHQQSNYAYSWMTHHFVYITSCNFVTLFGCNRHFCLWFLASLARSVNGDVNMTWIIRHLPSKTNALNWNGHILLFGKISFKWLTSYLAQLTYLSAFFVFWVCHVFFTVNLRFNCFYWLPVFFYWKFHIKLKSKRSIALILGGCEFAT